MWVPGLWLCVCVLHSDVVDTWVHFRKSFFGNRDDIDLDQLLMELDEDTGTDEDWTQQHYYLYYLVPSTAVRVPVPSTVPVLDFSTSSQQQLESSGLIAQLESNKI